MHNWRRLATATLVLGVLALGSCSDEEVTNTSGIEPQFAVPGGGWDLISSDVASVNGSFWISGSAFKVGTGVINPFLGIQKKDVEQGFNTDGNFKYDQTRTNFTDALPLNVVSMVKYPDEAGSWFREFIFDANEADAAPDAQFSIDEFELWLCHTGDAAPATYEDYTQFSTNTTDCARIYDFRQPMLTGTAKIGYATDGKTNGSGNSLDYYILVPESLFTAFLTSHQATCYYNPAANCGVYVILWNKLGGVGGDWKVGSTFEEYSTLVRPVPKGSKSGYKWHDLDADGVKEAGEPGLENWVIQLYEGATLKASTITDATGFYQFTDILPGSYTVKEVCPANWKQKFPAPTGGVCGTGVHNFEMMYGENYTDNNFGNYQLATKSGTKFHDLNANGVKDAGEPGLAAWTIYVDYDDDNVKDAGEPFAVTGLDGTYNIVGIEVGGPWKVREVAQAGWTCSYPSPCYHNETFTSGATLTGNDFGNYQSATKSGYKWHDLDADGVKEAGEPGLASWTIKLFQGATEKASTTTNASGYYEFTGIVPGSYTVKEVCAATWLQSYPAPSGGVCGTGVHNVTLTSGQADTENNFGNYQLASKSGVKFEDLDADGAAREAGEPGLAGWTIYVDYDDNGAKDAGEPSAVTAADGTYSITGINVGGPWKVREVAQAGWTCSYPSPCYHNETFTSGATLTGNDFGNYRMATKSGYKWHDLDADGVKEAGEPGLADWTIKLFQGATEIASTTTNASGYYEFTGIVPGSYTVKEVCPADWLQSYPAPSGGVCGTGVYNITLTSGQADTENNFGNYQLASKSGSKWNDLNRNGTWDAGEPGLAGWTITLLQGGTTVTSTTTDAAGLYTFGSLLPGTYAVCETPQSPWVQTWPTTGYACANGTVGYEFVLTSGEVEENNNFGNNYPLTGYTAWAANGDVPLLLPYNAGGTGNWATYVQYAAKTVTLFAGQTKPAGTVTFSAVSGGMVTITVQIAAGWSFDDVSRNVLIQDYASAPSGNPSPGQFAWYGKGTGNTFSITVPANNFYGVHVLVIGL